ncbi:NnrU family protein [Pacificimonas sp. WHA3]|uniref:NnrU family protein n=1 Tax=Pacificimonas pallii TaxID=2827236 RepID=A0ABS6SH81_9SPHN|nr:NnrU family protein [Pacificimonas pallii]MBV7257251.1 NnrU family protein [Pacificimonas pallii]
MTELVIAMALFVGSHFLMSHPLRAPMVGALGEKGFLGVYSLVSLALLIWAALAYGGAPDQQLWFVYFWVVIAGHVLMLLASILYVGSVLKPNPALVGAQGSLAKISEPQGAMRITRHPMMWSFALWAIAHIAMNGTFSTLVFAGGIGFLALAGARAQDAKKARLIGAAWTAYAAKTSFWPRLRWPGLTPVIAGTVLYAVLVAAHPYVFGVTTRLWEFIL